MKKQKDNLKSMNEVELKTELGVLQEKIRVIKFKAEGAKSKNVKEEANLRKQVARILTKINKK